MAAGRNSATRARVAALALPGGAAALAGRLPPVRFAPSARSLAAGLVVGALAAGAYGVASATSAFSVRHVAVRGADHELAAEVRAALRPLLGRSLVSLDGRELVQRAAGIPRVAAVRYDRAFPDTVTVTIRAERPVAVIRSGRDAWLVSARGRVLDRVPRRSERRLPRLWLKQMPFAIGELVAGAPRRGVHVAADAAADLRALRVRAVSATHANLTLYVASGLKVRLGDDRALALKMAVTRAIVGKLPPVRAGGPTYLDVTVPDRAVTGGATLESEVEVEGTRAPRD